MSVTLTSFWEQAKSPVPGKAFTVVELRASGKLEYEIRPVA
ncbi:MAG TPA: hypothetical protein VK638_04915 [Edaphobacter sp.]|nr:hypothetical protein [Edaphobacter sp.]